MKRPIAIAAAFVALAGPVAAHHGWGSYDAANPITVIGPITTAKYENPHATITVKAKDKEWTVMVAWGLSYFAVVIGPITAIGLAAW